MNSCIVRRFVWCLGVVVLVGMTGGPAQGTSVLAASLLRASTEASPFQIATRRIKRKKRHNKRKKARKNKRAKKRNAKRNKGRKNKNQRNKTHLNATAGSEKVQPKETPALDLSQLQPEEATAPVLDLSNLGAADEEEVRQEILQVQESAPKKKRKKKKGFDFGGTTQAETQASAGAGSFDFGLEEFDVGGIDLNSTEQLRFDDALALMADEKYLKAAEEFRFFLSEENYADYRFESEYQLAKSLYKLEYFDAALKYFKAILEQGPTHRRYRKSVEWLFFMSRKMADETPVLAELARFRNVQFPKAYRNEYKYLLAKYLFMQANSFEVARLRAARLAKSKSAKSASFDFEAAAEGGFDFGGGGGVASGGFDFGGGDDGAASEGFDFGGGDDGAASGGFDFGGGDAGGDNNASGGFDFGGGAEAGGFNFGGGATQEPSDANTPVRQQAPQTTQEAIRQGLELIAEVDEASSFGPRAIYLKGLMHYLSGEAQEAVNAFQKVVRLLNPREGGRLDHQLRENAFLSLARIHYGHQQFDRSAYYYDLIGRDSESWLTSLFEASWAYYQRGDYEKALGNLLTLHAPFFEREYFPESKIVKAIIYFEACRYQETRVIVDDFLNRFTKVMREIQKVVDSKEAPEKLYARIKALAAASAGTGGDDVTTRVVNLALGDADISTARNVLAQVEEQIALLKEQPQDFRNGKVGHELKDELESLRSKRAKEAGEITRAKFEEELYALKSLLAQAVAIKIEVVRSERKSIEAKMRGQKVDEVMAAQARTVVDDEHVYWPYEGEYWRDELGTYELDFSQCSRAAAQ